MCSQGIYVIISFFFFLFNSIIYPQNKKGEPEYNPCGKYMVKLHINGVPRKVNGLGKTFILVITLNISVPTFHKVLDTLQESTVIIPILHRRKQGMLSQVTCRPGTEFLVHLGKPLQDC